MFIIFIFPIYFLSLIFFSWDANIVYKQNLDGYFSIFYIIYVFFNSLYIFHVCVVWCLSKFKKFIGRRMREILKLEVPDYQPNSLIPGGELIAKRI